MIDDERHGGGPDELAPVIPLFGARTDEHAVAHEREHPVWGESRAPVESMERRAPSESRERRALSAEEVLLRKLRTRSLSVSEARAALRAADVESLEVDEVVDDFIDRGYLNDRALADQLVLSGSERKAQGRKAIALALAKRGVPRDIADEALADLPDDDAERALEFAQTKARQLDRFDRETAVRRLVGQLARRGYSGSSALEAARSAVDEHRGGRPRHAGGTGSGVRFR